MSTQEFSPGHHAFEPGRARRIVKLAAKEAKSAKAWLTLDERGTWERTALEYLAKAEQHPLAQGMSATEIDAQVALAVGLLATRALLEEAIALNQRKSRPCS